MLPEHSELKELLGVLREAGVLHFIGLNVELTLSERDPQVEKAVALEHKEIMQKIENVKESMRLDDDQLIDRMFPVPVEGEEAPALQE